MQSFCQIYTSLKSLMPSKEWFEKFELQMRLKEDIYLTRTIIFLLLDLASCWFLRICLE